MPITSPVERISGPEDQVHARQLAEGEHRLLDRDVGLQDVVLQAELLERLARP